MADTNTPVKNEENGITATSLVNISQKAMLEIIGMKPVRGDNNELESNALAEEEPNITDTSTKTSNELKSILQLAKEAKLDTNIGHKRKSMDVSKTNERLEQSEKGSSEEKDLRNKLEQKLITDSAAGIVAKGKIKKIENDDEQQNLTSESKDSFCWRCHKADINISCEVCPRSYHVKCVKQNISADLDNWLCPECLLTLKSENTATRSAAMKDMTVEHLCNLLKFALKRMIKCTSTEPFMSAVSEREFPDYRKYIVQPMDLNQLEKQIKDNVYGSPQAFEADAKWILHNSIIYNGYQSKLTTAAKTIIKVCKQEMQEIENCPTCYLNANVKKNSWFVEVCPKPHILLWAKLKSFPYWPAKAMATNAQGMVDARFFGAHDRAWIPVKDCFLFSRKDPNSSNVQKNNINECIKELEVHAAKLKEIYGEFNYAPYKTPYDPELETEQIKIFLPKYKPQTQQRPILGKIKASNGKSSPSNDSTSSSSSASSSNGIHKGRGRSRSRHRKSVVEENKDMEGYGTDDDFESSLNSEKRKQLLKSFQQNDEKQQEDKSMIKEKRTSSCPQEKESENRNVSRSSKGEYENKSDVQSSPSTQNNDPKETIEPPFKRFKRISEKVNDQSIKNDSNRPSNISDKINKVNIDENMEITLGNTNTTEKNDSSSLNETVNYVVKTKNAVQVDVENKELTISPQNKTKISDKIIRILNNSDEAIASSSTDKDKEMTQTDLLLKEYSSQKQTDVQVTENSKTGDSRKNLLEDTQVDEVNINSMIFDKKSSEKDMTSKKGKKRSVGSSETNESSQNKTQKLMISNLKHNVILNETSNFDDRSLVENNMNEMDPLALVEVKTEPHSDEESTEREIVITASKPNSSAAKKNNDSAKAMDNLTKVINAVAAGSITSTTSRPNSPKATSSPLRKANKARKSFPAPKPFENQTATACQCVAMSFPSQQQIINQTTPPSIKTGGETFTAVTNLLPKTTTTNVEFNESQNYIPQNIPSSSFVKITDVLPTTSISTATTSVAVSQTTTTNASATNACLTSIMEEFCSLKDSLPETAAKAVSDLICKLPPKLKPRPPSAITEGFEECVPSSVGHVTSKLNSVAYRMTDYFRGLLTETLQDISTEFGDNTAAVAVLKAEIEQLKHRHSMEILEIKKNVYTILKDIQKSIAEEQKKLVEETRATCEAEATRRIQEAKSKQWCAQCFKEAQFYCCWNTSYCDYSCQQKHWPKHVSKCTQNVTNQIPVAKSPQVQPLVLRPAPPPNKNTNVKPLLPKATKVVFNARAGNISNQITQIMKSTSAGHITLVESTPGNYEIINDGSVKMGGKVLTNTSVMSKFKSGNIVTVTSPSTSALLVSSSSQNGNNSSSGNSATTNTVTFGFPTITNVMSLANQGV